MSLSNENNENKPIPEIVVQSLLKSPTVAIRDTYCQGNCRHKSAEECTSTTQLVFPYRGVFMRHVGQDQTVAEANQVLFFNATEGYHQLPANDVHFDAGFSLLEPLSDADQLPDAMFQRGVHLALHAFVSLVEVTAALGMS